MQDIMEFARNHLVLCLAWVALLVLVIVTTFKGLFSKVKTISRSEATNLINKQDAVVVDVRSRDDFRRGHISGAVNLAAAEIKKGHLTELEKFRNQPVIVTCATGQSSGEAAGQLSAAGFANVSVLKDGISGWSGENLPLVRGK
ncbi:MULTISPECIES: rhodanese-like domain-containing protein [Tatumella]|uniref:Rhodanese-like domain-containing protein n=1 Tax=Tatumella punctata TaxID=399969 RepID=A0ABW1VSA2_9GAMM|nr:MULTISPECIES: rhodanese-like domain-containing protein [unclassified Tatumella]MBS0856605.1 rhodanese-like domain-containing protein [Tatumella sp. JGM16]MBS0877910.1 rhodanese-like domain-containing protein [Tatumella sp. JGM82]MBS0891616.1 rhodanese-like domain-containing protein [Tatumella sp. JGM94]MBS0893839.1 rhodanese-like domain-containing protein [Tatumella sp. JGM130]MBS0902560.1 rhodanese-like domain-containing protein [Tatumella sp. JGM100]